MKFQTPLSYKQPKGKTISSKEKEYIKTKCPETGKIIMEEDGYTEPHIAINELAKETSIHNFIKVNSNNEIEAVYEVNKDKAFYGDYTNVPETRGDALRMLNQGKYLQKEINKMKAEDAKNAEKAKAAADNKTEVHDQAQKTKTNETNKKKESDK